MHAQHKRRPNQRPRAEELEPRALPGEALGWFLLLPLNLAPDLGARVAEVTPGKALPVGGSTPTTPPAVSVLPASASGYQTSGTPRADEPLGTRSSTSAVRPDRWGRELDTFRTELDPPPTAGVQNTFGLIVNGGFEGPDIGKEPYRLFKVGDPGITGWAVLRGNVEIVSRNFSAPYEGNQWLDLIGTDFGVVRQSFPTVPGRVYVVSFAYANNPNVERAGARVDVAGARTTLLSAEFSAKGSTFKRMVYFTFAGTFVAESGTTAVTFTATEGSPDSGIALDRVSVRPGVSVRPVEG